MCTDHKTAETSPSVTPVNNGEAESGDVSITDNTPIGNSKPQNISRLGLTDFQFDNAYNIIIRCPAGHLSWDRAARGLYTISKF